MPSYVRPRQDEDTLWLQYCVLRCCPSPAKRGNIIARRARTKEMFQKDSLVSTTNVAREQNTSHHLRNMLSSVMLPQQCVLVLPGLFRGRRNEDTLWRQHCWGDHVSAMLTRFATRATFVEDANFGAWTQKNGSENLQARKMLQRATSHDTMLPQQCVLVVPGPKTRRGVRITWFSPRSLFTTVKFSARSSTLPS